MDKDYVKNVERYIIELIEEYAKRKSIFEPLSKLLGEYWNDIFLRAVRNVMFEKVEKITPLEYIKAKDKWDLYTRKYIWKIKRHNDCPMEHNYVEWIAKKIINEHMRLRKMVWYVNGWGEPYCKKLNTIYFEYKDVNEKGEIFMVVYDAFKKKFLPRILPLVKDNNEEIAEMLVRSIYKVINDVWDTSIDEGFGIGKQTQTDKLVDIYNDIELGLSDLKKIIDEQ